MKTKRLLNFLGRCIAVVLLMGTIFYVNSNGALDQGNVIIIGGLIISFIMLFDPELNWTDQYEESMEKRRSRK